MESAPAEHEEDERGGGGGGEGEGGRRRRRKHARGGMETVREKMKNLVAPHIESYDAFIKGGLQQVVAAQKPVTCRTKLEDGSRVELMVQLGEVQLRKPRGFGEYPRECREAKKTYATPAFVWVNFFLRTAPRAGTWGSWDCVYERLRPLGELPIMVCSEICKLSNMNAEELTQKPCEHEREVGGYFIVNGVEKVVRMLVQSRRHYPLALRRPAYAQKREGFTEFCVSMRSIDWKSGCNAHTVRIHYVNDGSASVAIRLGKIEYFVPLGVLLRALSDLSERDLFEMLAGRGAAAANDDGGTSEHASSENSERNSFMSLRADLILERTARLGIRNENAALQYLGKHFRQELGFPPTTADDGDNEFVRDAKSDADVGLYLLDECLFRHLQDREQKLSLLVLMVRKLWMVVRGDCCEDNADTLDSQELLLPGQLLGMIAFDRLEIWLKNIARQAVQTWTKRGAQRLGCFGSTEHLKSVVDVVKCDVGQKIEYMLATGNVMPGSNVGVGQSRGLSVVAERLNYLRYISHFRSVHRGAYFATMRTTTVRKLMPESFGFMCPVHTPDGSPCGLLLHLSHMCRVVTEHTSPELLSYLVQSGMQRVEGNSKVSQAFLYDETYVHVILDGEIVGYVPRSFAPKLAANMRRDKRMLLSVPCTSTNAGNDDAHISRIDTASGGDRNQEEGANTCRPSIPWHTEVAFLPPSRGGPFPGLFIYTQAARMVRPVVPLIDVGGANELRGPVIGTGRQRHCRVRVEYIGSLEQLFMDIECERSGVGGLPSLDSHRSTHITHAEVMPTAMLSLVASLTPWSDYNQSPRNMYQCQMAKQTMGTPCHNFKHNMDTKMYRLHTPQRPISRTVNHEAFGIDDFALGTNAVVAVLSYTGYDMEDAMIINKSSMERGFAHGSLYKTSVIQLDKDEEQFSSKGDVGNMRFDGRFKSVVDLDGLPRVGERLRQGDAYCRTVNTVDCRSRDAKLVDEAAEVDSVTIVGDGQKDMENNIRRANIKFRINRNPVIGDKFARYGRMRACDK